MTVIRPAREEDVEAAAEMLNEHSRRLHGADDMTAADLLTYWTSPDVELGRDVCSLRARTAGSAAMRTWASTETPSGWMSEAPIPRLCPRCSRRSSSARRTKEPDKKLWGYTSADDAPLVELFERKGYRKARHSFHMRIDLDGESVGARVARRRLRPGDARGRGAPGLRRADGVLRGHMDVRPRPVRQLAALDGRGAVVRPFPVVRRRAGWRARGDHPLAGARRTSRASVGCASWASCRSTADAAWDRHCSSTRSPSSQSEGSRRSGSESTPRTRPARFASTSGPGCMSSGRT